MDNVQFDGECHAISDSKQYGYIAHKVGTELQELQEKIEQKIGKYAEYLYSYNKEEVIRILIDVMRSEVFHGWTPDNYQIIHRPPYIISAIAQYGTVVLKFKRAQNDNLDIKNESV